MQVSNEANAHAFPDTYEQLRSQKTLPQSVENERHASLQRPKTENTSRDYGFVNEDKRDARSITLTSSQEQKGQDIKKTPPQAFKEDLPQKRLRGIHERFEELCVAGRWLPPGFVTNSPECKANAVELWETMDDRHLMELWNDVSSLTQVGNHVAYFLKAVTEGWVFVEECEECGSQYLVRKGRRRLYCSSTCRQRACRRRHQEALTPRFPREWYSQIEENDMANDGVEMDGQQVRKKHGLMRALFGKGYTPDQICELMMENGQTIEELAAALLSSGYKI
jgi:hypothetical protein